MARRLQPRIVITGGTGDAPGALLGFGPAGALSGKSRAGHWRTLEYERSLFSRKFVLDTTAATVEELVTVSGIGAAKAARILEVLNN